MGQAPGETSRRRSRHLVVLAIAMGCAAMLASVVVGGCSTPTGYEETRERDPWVSAGVDNPRISTRTSDGRTTVTAHLETTSPLENASNRDSFAERAAKILWRTHLGRVDTFEVTTLQRNHPESRRDRTWQRAELERKFGARLVGLDAGDKAALRQHEPAGDGPYAGRSADRLPQAITVLRQVVQETAQARLGTEPVLGEPYREECLGGIADTEPTGEFRALLEADLELPEGAQPSQVVVAAAAQWAEMGLEVDRFYLFTGTEDRIRGKLPGIGDLVLSEHPGRGAVTGILEVTYITECFGT